MHVEFREASAKKPGLRGVTTPFKDITNEKYDNIPVMEDVKLMVENEQESQYSSDVTKRLDSFY